MTLFRPHEVQAIRRLAERLLSAAGVDDLIAHGTLLELEETGGGYLLTAAHPALPRQRFVCSQPSVSGRVGDLVCGYVLFFEEGRMMLECHSWGPGPWPDGFRELDVEVIDQDTGASSAR